jgi:hypothetical protein
MTLPVLGVYEVDYLGEEKTIHQQYACEQERHIPINEHINWKSGINY